MALLAAATASHFWGFGGEALEGVCLRIGLVMAMLWLALPQTRQLKSKLVIGGLIAAFGIVAFRPKFLPVLLKVAPVFLGALFVLSLFRRKKAEGQAGGDRRREVGIRSQESGDRS